MAFLYIPMIFSGYWSFTKYNGLQTRRVGRDRELRSSSSTTTTFIKALWNTVLFVILGMGIGPALGLMTALLLNQKVNFRGFFRTAYFLPVMTSLVVVATIWKILYQENGLINSILHVLRAAGSRVAATTPRRRFPRWW